MAEVTREGNILQIGESVRIESGPLRKTATATEELLDNAVTASHYQVDRADADGKPIQIGEDMTYLDWLGHSEGADGATGHYVYKLEPMTDAEVEERGAEPGATIWREIGCEATEEAALALALANA